jgi:hypothetical protein
MRSWLVIALALVAMICALRAAYLWGRSTHVRPEPKGFEPVIPELKQNWWKLAEWAAAERSGGFNRQAAWWTAAAAIFGFASVAVGVWPNSN